MNSVFRIVFGDYELALDRKTLAYDLTETKTGTKWGVGLSVGWIEVEDRESGAVVRHDFGDCKLISLSEKMSGQGKRLLLGLDTPEGLPVDVYFTCAEKEIQLTVEASRDSKTHTLHAIGLLPGLCSVPEDSKSHYVLPIGEGAMVFPSELGDPAKWPLWREIDHCLTMPFLGAVRMPQVSLTPGPSLGMTFVPQAREGSSALALITDSVYASARLSRASCDWEYARDPERRRLEIRLVLVPGGDHVAIARAYRDKLVGERAHVTLRKKIRERPALEAAIGKPWVFPENTSPSYTLQAGIRENRWKQMDDWITTMPNEGLRIAGYGHDWVAPYIDASIIRITGYNIPLYCVVHRDAVVPLVSLDFERIHPLLIPVLCLAGFPREDLISAPIKLPSLFLHGLLRLAAPHMPKRRQGKINKVAILLATLHAKTFHAFLQSHRFLTEDLAVQEAVYTDKTRVVVNFSEENAYETEEFSLPPLGFYVNNPQMVLHDASRVGDEVFPERAWRVSRKSEVGEWTREEFPLGENLRGPI